MSKEAKQQNNLKILDGRALRDKAAVRLRQVIAERGKKPTLAILQVGSVSESSAYIERKREFAEKIGAGLLHLKFPDDVPEQVLLEAIEKLNADSAITGIILQLPIPASLNKQKIIDTIIVSKDTDGLTTENKNFFEAGDDRAVVPATARGVLSLLKGYNISIKDKKVVVVGRSALVGAPVARLLEREGATVTVCHSQTENVPEKTRNADILVVAIGKPRFITKDYVSAGQTVIDVGINSVEGERLEEEIPKRKLVGDVDFEGVKGIVGAISPVPGGVGPMTVLSLFENLVSACEIQVAQSN